MRIAEWLWENPMLRPEWARVQRRKRSRGVLRTGLDLLIFLGAYTATAFCLSFGGQGSQAARAYSPSLCLLYLLWVNIRAPGPAAASISGERERRTWEMLQLTALRPSQVVSAKFLTGVWPSVTALGGFVPPILISAQAAGLPTTGIAALLAVLFASPVVVVALSLWLSGRCRHTRTAVTLAYLMAGLFCWYWVVLFLAGATSAASVWCYACPVWHVAVLYGATPIGYEWSWFLLGCGALSGLTLALLTRRIAGGDE